MISIAVLEDDELMQNRLVEILKSWHYVKEVFAFDSNREFNELSKKIQFDILLADINVSDGNGIESVKLLTKTNPKGISIMISSNSRPDVIIESIRAGAIGYIYKDDSKIEIIQAIRAALQNEAPISPGIAFTILKSLQESKNTKATNIEKEPKNLLSPRETEIIQLISKGMSNDEVSLVLGLSTNTIPVHVRNIYKKLGTTRRTEAVFEARHLGIIK
jgi:DNA-binding NarL/FixJ family response regulator